MQGPTTMPEATIRDSLRVLSMGEELKKPEADETLRDTFEERVALNWSDTEAAWVVHPVQGNQLPVH